MNVFRDTLRGIAERVADTRAVAIVGADGIPVETYSVGEDVSIESVAAELMALVKSAQNPRAELSFGPIRELALVGEGQRAVLSRISPEYYLLLLLGGEGTLGHGRYELARAATGLQEELS
jgi:predicted regulator of Ras-like GTPase activity (Roadblock/LC7/MglB family)